MLVVSESGRGYDADDLALAELLARRAALAVENARLFLHAQEATRARDEMLAVVAHDLRNPLSTITMGASLLLEGTAEHPERTEEHQHHLAIICRSAERMNRLIEDLLDVTRMESGGIRLEPRPEAVGPLLDEGLGMLEPIASAQGLRLEREIGGELSPIRVDATRFLQVVSNLVGNAIKFTPRGGRIVIGARSRGREVHFSVSDTGPGIQPEQLPHIFGRFWQARAADRRGIGLGLSIAKGIVDAHGGQIWVESAPGEGSTFHFTVPQAEEVGGTARSEPAGGIVYEEQLTTSLRPQSGGGAA
jgi:signal transduction histidine kinase